MPNRAVPVAKDAKPKLIKVCFDWRSWFRYVKKLKIENFTAGLELVCDHMRPQNATLSVDAILWRNKMNIQLYHTIEQKPSH